jgi:hypothetical protein
VKSILILLALTGPARAAIEHDFDVIGDQRNGHEVDLAVSVGAGQARYALVGVTVTGTAARVSAVHAGATSFGFINGSDAEGGGCRSEWWGLRDPPVGDQMVIVELAADTPFAGATFVSYRGVDQHRPLGSMVSAKGMLPPTGVILSAAPDALALENTCGWGPASVLDDAGGGQTALWHWSIGALSSAGSVKPGASNVSLTWTAGGDHVMAWAATGLVLNPAGGAPPTTTLDIGTTGCAAAGRPGRPQWWLLAAAVALRRAGRRFREHRRGSRV